MLSSSPPPSVPASAAALSLKVKERFSGECRRVALARTPPLSFSALQTRLCALFGFPSSSASSLSLTFLDEEAELVTIASEDEWRRLQSDHARRGEKVLVLYVDRQQPQPMRSPAPPLSSAESIAAFPSPLSSDAAIASPITSDPPPSSSADAVDAVVDGVEFTEAESPESPVLVDGAGVPSLPDSQFAAARYRRAKYAHSRARRGRRGNGATDARPRPPLRPDVAASQPQPQPLPLAAPVVLSAPFSPSRKEAMEAKEARSERPSVASSPASPAAASAAPPSPATVAADAPPAPRSFFSSPPAVLLSHRFGQARAQLRSLFPFGRSPSTEPSEAPAAAAGIADPARPLSERETARRLRVASAYASLAAFVRSADDEDDGLSREELLNRVIALYTYSQRWLAHRRALNDALSAGLGLDRSADDAAAAACEEDQRRALLCDAQRSGLRSQSSGEALSPSSPALVTLLTITQAHLRSRQVTDLPVTLELMAAVLAEQSEAVDREERREAELRRREQQQLHQAQQGITARKGAEVEELKAPLSPFSAPSIPASTSGAGMQRALAAAVSALPAALQAGVWSLVVDLARHAADVAGRHPAFSFASLSPHSFASTLHAFKTDCQDAVHDERLTPPRPSRTGHFPLAATDDERRGDGCADEEEEEEEEEEADEEALDNDFRVVPPPEVSSRAASSASPPAAAVMDAGRGDVILSDTAVLKAMAKALRKDQRRVLKAMKAEEKRRRRAGKGKAGGGAAALLSAVRGDMHDDEAQELSELIAHMDAPHAQHRELSAAHALVGSWQLFPQQTPPLPAPSVASPSSSPASGCPPPAQPSPFAFQPFPYSLHSERGRAQDGAPGGRRAASSPRPAPPQPASAMRAPASVDPALHPRLAHTAAFPPLHSAPVTALSAAAAAAATAAAAQPTFASVVAGGSSQSAPPSAPSAAAAVSAQSRPSDPPALLHSLWVMGFTDEALNRRLLHSTGNDLNQVVEWLLVHNEVDVNVAF